MFICPVCAKAFGEEQVMIRHYLTCWKKHNPYHKSKDAPHSTDIESRKINDELQSFFERKQL